MASMWKKCGACEALFHLFFLLNVWFQLRTQLFNPPYACHCGSSDISLISKAVVCLCRLWPVTKHNMAMLSLKGWDSWKRLAGNFISIRDDGDTEGRTHSLLVPPGARERIRAPIRRLGHRSRCTESQLPSWDTVPGVAILSARVKRHVQAGG